MGTIVYLQLICKSVFSLQHFESAALQKLRANLVILDQQVKEHHPCVVMDTDLEDADVRVPVRSLSAAVDDDVFEPLDVRLRVAEHAAHEHNVAAHDGGLVGG